MISADLRSFVESAVASYESELLAFARAKLNRSEVARDLVQNTFLKLWENRHSLSLEISIRGWLFHVLKNQIRSFRRRKPWVSLEGAYIEPATDHQIECLDEDSLHAILPHWNVFSHVCFNLPPSVVLFLATCIHSYWRKDAIQELLQLPTYTLAHRRRLLQHHLRRLEAHVPNVREALFTSRESKTFHTLCVHPMSPSMLNPSPLLNASTALALASHTGTCAQCRFDEQRKSAKRLAQLVKSSLGRNALKELDQREYACMLEHGANLGKPTVYDCKRISEMIEYCRTIMRPEILRRLSVAEAQHK